MMLYGESFVLILLFFNACNSQNITSTCGKLELSCDDQCLSIEQLCDGIKQCKTGLDESHETCNRNECPGHTFRCSTGACIENSKVCNQIDDCLDSSDEIPFLCSEKSSPIYEDCGYSDFVTDNGLFPWTIKFYENDYVDDDDEDYAYVKKEWTIYSSGTLVTPNIVITDYIYFWRDKLKLNELIVTSTASNDKAIQKRKIADIVFPKVELDQIQISNSYIVIVKVQRPFVYNTFTYAACLDARPIQIQKSLDLYEGVVALSMDKRVYLKKMLPDCTRIINNVTTSNNTCQTELATFIQTDTPVVCLEDENKGMALFNIVNDRYYLRSVFVYQNSSQCEIMFYVHIHTFIDIIKNIDPPSSYLASNYSVWGNEEIKDLDVVSKLSKSCGEFQEDGVTPYPWHAAIWSERSGSPIRICAGTIIAPKYVVTAVSCFWDFNNERFRDLLLDTYSVSSGFNGETFAQFSKVFHVHTDNYLWESNGQSDVNNLAIVEIESNFQFDRFVQPACIDFKEEHIENILDKKTAIMISWLVKGVSDNYAPGQLTGTFLSNEICSKYLNNRCTECEAEVPKDYSKLCLTYTERGSLTDYGAGIFTQRNNRYYLRGILNRPIIPDDVALSVYYRLFSNIIPFTKVIKTILNTYQPEGDIIFEPSVCSSGYDVPCNKSSCIGFMSICNFECECGNCADEDELMCYLGSTPRLVDDCGEFDKDTSDFKPWRSGVFVPWHAGILIQGSNEYEIICAASIVSPMYLISAANCFWDTANNSLSTEQFYVGAGYKNNNTFLQYRNITNIITKDYLPEYWWNRVSRESHFNNIAIIKLDSSLNFDENVKAVCLTSIFQKPQYYPHFDPYNLVSWTRGNLYGRNDKLFEITSFFNIHCRNLVPKISAPEYMDSNRKKCFYVRDCGPDNDNGNGLSIKINGRYYLYAVSNPKIRTQRRFKCQYYTFTTLGFYFDFIKSNILI